ncbi:DUF4185 domain-containing protein [Streptomyces sp. WM6386]|uniref:DUF4185 domain-containing protein n=1 Tax=Streptomyces sp. WM6386 TaxID=1415558 RepID=UPI00061910A7|nr:DUF4185 domain-containing protein [Streptomyces sp. WM6386]KKD08233.1 hypothetical protein TN53_09680 [Streptomyces sp. WM6386]
MPDDVRARQRTGTGLGLLLALVLGAVLLTALPEDDDRQDAGDCIPHTVGAWSADNRLTGEFARYGDDATRADDWTGGDGTHSVRLPDGRVLWLFSDTYLGQVYAPPNPVGESFAWRDTTAPLVRNSAVLMREDRLEATLPAPLFPDPAPDQWRWPVAARVEPREPGSHEQVVRVLLWVRTAGAAPWIYGTPTATEVATLSLPDLRVESITKVFDQQLVPDASRRVLFGTTLIKEDGWTYVFGGDDGQAASRPVSSAYVARVPEGRLGEPSAWQYWNGSTWDPGAHPAPVLGNERKRTGVGSAYSVVRKDGTYVLFTMAAGTAGLTTVTSYWACSPTGPWHGPTRNFGAALPDGEVAAYNPQVHSAVSDSASGAGSGGGRLVLSYDVNWLEPAAAAAQLNRNVSLYRPRFVTLTLKPRK